MLQIKGPAFRDERTLFPSQSSHGTAVKAFLRYLDALRRGSSLAVNKMITNRIPEDRLKPGHILMVLRPLMTPGHPVFVYRLQSALLVTI